jgi:hypothetical protein
LDAAKVKEVNDMAKYMTLWRTNPSAQWPMDPIEAFELNEMMFAAIDEGLKSGRILESGWFSNGTSGYTISSGDVKGVFASAFANFPWIETEVHEVVDWETGKGIARQVLKAQAEQMATMQR